MERVGVPQASYSSPTPRSWRYGVGLASPAQMREYERNYPLALGTLGLIFLKWLDEQAAHDRFSLPEQCRWERISSDPSGESLSKAADILEERPDCRRYGRLLRTLKIHELAKGARDLRKLFKYAAAFPVGSAAALDVPSNQSLFADALGNLGWVGREHSTPPELISLVSLILASERGSTFYDPVCGTGDLLTAVASAAGTRSPDQPNAALFGQDINEGMAAVAEINCIMKGFGSFSVGQGDVLQNPLFVAEDTVRRFDRVVADLPALKLAGAGLRKALHQDKLGRFTYGVPKRATALLLLQHVVASLNEGGRAAVLVDPSALNTVEDAGIRRKMVEDDLVEAVISIPVGIGPTLTKNIVVLRKNRPKEHRHKILFVYAPEEQARVMYTREAVSDLNRARIVACVNEYKQQPRFSSIVETDNLTDDCRLAPERYVDLVGRDTFLGGAVEWKSLGTMATLLRGQHISGAYREGQEAGVPLVMSKDLSRHKLSPDDLVRVDVSKLSEDATVYLETGDILIRGAGSLPECRSVDEALKGALAGEDVYVVRPKEGFSHLAQYVAEFFNSHLGRALLASRLHGAVLPKLTISDLLNMPVPVPESNVVGLINDLHFLEQDLLERVDRARNIRRQLFDIDDPDRASAELRRLSTESQVLAGSLLQADDLRFRVQNFYPFPLAYAYRTLTSYHEPATLYQEQLRIVENAVTFLAIIGMALVDKAGLLSRTDQEPLTSQYLIDKWRSGMSPGHWLSIGQASARALRTTKNLSLAEGFASLWFKGAGKPKQTEFAQMLWTLVEEKNDLKHDRGPKTTHEYEQYATRLSERLEALFDGLSLFVQHPMRLVQHMDLDWKTSQFMLDTLSYTGDHPGLRREHVMSSVALPSGKLYIASSNEDWVPLYPLLSVQHCERCGARETYFVDKWKNLEKVPTYKSFEHGHAHSQGDVPEAISKDLTYWVNANLRGVAI